MKKLTVGMTVEYVDHKGVSHPALVTSVFGSEDFNPETDHTCINIVYVEGDESKSDMWGRQICRDSSVPFERVQSAHGNYWNFLD